MAIAEGLHFSHRPRVSIEVTVGSMLTITLCASMNPTHTINKPALDVMHPVALRPSQAFIKGPVSRIKRVGMKPNFHSSVPAKSSHQFSSSLVSPSALLRFDLGQVARYVLRLDEAQPDLERMTLSSCGS